MMAICSPGLPDRVYPVTEGPADDAPGIRVDDHRKAKPALAGPDMTDIASPSLIGPAAEKPWSSRLGAMLKGVVAVRTALVFLCSCGANPILLHQPSDPPFPNSQAKLLTFGGHARPPIADQTQAPLLADMRQQHHVLALMPTKRPVPPSA